MKLLGCLGLFALLASALCGSPMMMMDMMLGPPMNIDECMERMKVKMDVKMEVMERMFEAKWNCKKSCLSEKQMKCMPDEAFKMKLKKMHEDMKMEFMEVKEKARACLKGKIGSGCSNTPMRWGLCGIGIAKMLMGKEVKMCMGECMMKDVKSKVMEFIMKNAGKPGFPEMSELMKMKNMMMKKKEGKKGMMKAMMMGKMGKKKGMCISLFCEVDAMMECAKSSGLQDIYMKKKKMKSEVMKMMEEMMFPKVCTCLKDAATTLPEYLKSFNCENKPNSEVCGMLHVDFMEMMMKKMNEDEVAARKKREAEHIYNMEEFDELESFDAFDLE